MYGPKGVGRSGFGAFTAKKRADQAALGADHRSDVAPATPAVPAAEAPPAPTAGASPQPDEPSAPLRPEQP